MNLPEKIKRLLPTFDVVWKLCLLAALLWIGQSLQEIARQTYVGDNPPDTTESINNESFDSIDKAKPQSSPGDSAIPDQVRV